MQNKFKEFTIVNVDNKHKKKSSLGSLSLDNVCPILISDETIEVDLGLLHAKSSVERGIRFLKETDEEAFSGKEYWIVWLTINYEENKPFYFGLTCCKMIIDSLKRLGIKNLAFHVNQMDKSLKGKIDLSNLPLPKTKKLVTFLKNYNRDIWENSQNLQQAFFNILKEEV